MAVNILWSGWQVVSESLSGLLDEAVPDGDAAAIRDDHLGRGEGAVEAHDLRTRHAGRATFIDFHLIVPGETSVRDAHEICDRVEAALRDAVPDANVTIHVEPEHKAKHTGIVVVDFAAPRRGGRRDVRGARGGGGGAGGDGRRAALPGAIEGVKWNAPNWAVGGRDVVTLNLAPKGPVRVVLHRGARAVDTRTGARLLPDPRRARLGHGPAGHASAFASVEAVEAAGLARGAAARLGRGGSVAGHLQVAHALVASPSTGTGPSQ